MTMEKNKKILLFHIPMSICNFRCHYCYLAQRETCYQGVQPEMKYTPEQVRAAFSRKRLGGSCFMNFCAEGETLLTKDIDAYVKALVDEGHYAEIVTNMTVTNVIERILNWDKALLRRIEFKCSFHYLELKRKGLLETFAANVKKVWAAGASANVEITPSDELIPYIDEVKAFSLAHFGALPHLTIARDDRTSGIEYLTRLSPGPSSAPGSGSSRDSSSAAGSRTSAMPARGPFASTWLPAEPADATDTARSATLWRIRLVPSRRSLSGGARSRTAITAMR